jgi:hypothetical protein
MKAKAELLPQASVVATLLGISSLVHCSGPTHAEPSFRSATQTELLASLVEPLGVHEVVGGSYPGAVALSRSVSAEVAACLAPALDRVPSLEGTLQLRTNVGEPLAPRLSGTLTQHPLSDCIARSFERAARSAPGSGWVSYELSLTAKPAEPLLGYRLDSQLASFDWRTPRQLESNTLHAGLASVRDDLERCAFGAQPHMTAEAWLVLRVAADGRTRVVTKLADKFIGACFERHLRRVDWPTNPYDYAVSVLLEPSRSLQVDKAELPLKLSAAPASYLAKPRSFPPRTGGRLAPELIQRTVRRENAAINRCYEQDAALDKTSAGRISLTFAILADGKTSKVKNVRQGSLSEALGTCVEKVFSGLRFPAPDGGPLEIVYPIDLYPVETGKISGVPIANASLGMVEQRLLDQRIDFIPIPTTSDDSAAPGLFARFDGAVHGVCFAAGGGPPAKCARGDRTKALTLFGPSCETLGLAIVE